MTRESVKSSINFNSVLLMIVTALSAWTLKTVFDMAVAASGDHVRVENHEGRISNLEHPRRYSSTP